MRIHMTLDKAEGDYLLVPVNRQFPRHYRDARGAPVTHREVILTTARRQDEQLLAETGNDAADRLVGVGGDGTHLADHLAFHRPGELV